MGCFICVKTHFLFYVSKGHCFERKAKITFLKDCFGIWMILAFIYCGFWYYLYIVAKTSSSFSGFWHSNLFGTLRSKLDTILKIFVKSFYNFRMIGEKVRVFNKRYIFQIVGFINEETFDCFPKLFMIYYLLHSDLDSVFLVFFNKLTHLFLCLLYAFLPLLDFKEFFS